VAFLHAKYRDNNDHLSELSENDFANGNGDAFSQSRQSEKRGVERRDDSLFAGAADDSLGGEDNAGSGSENSQTKVKAVPHNAAPKIIADAIHEACPDVRQVRRFDAVLAEIHDSIRPSPCQIEYRTSTIALMKRQLRLTLRASAFECGLLELRCFLPDDATTISVVLGKGRVAQWHKTIHDRLCKLAEQPELCAVAKVREADDEFTTDRDDEYPIFHHTLSKVSVSSEDATFKVECVADAIDISICCNRRGDLCMLAFLEEVASLVGQDALFKRSLLLIRAWWVYETAALAGTSIKHYLGDFSICVMVCAVFNQYHARISSPLQALCLFLAEYSAYDGATHAITLQGIVPFKSEPGNALVSLPPQNHHLISAQIIEKFCILFNMKGQGEGGSAQFNAMNSPFNSSEEMNEELANGSFHIRGHAGAGAMGSSGHPYGSSQFGNNANARPYVTPSTTTRFERSGINIVHPFTQSNMVEKLVPRRLQRVQKALVAGAAQCLTLCHLGADETPTNVAQAVRAMFPAVTARFGNGFMRPDRMEGGVFSGRMPAR
jgi:hypothetical protein